MPASDGLVVDIVDLPQSLGATRAVEVTVPAPADLGTEVIGVPQDSPVSLEAVLTAVDEGVLVRASASLSVHGQCVRCLTDLEEDRTITFDELYLAPEALQARVAEGDEEAEEMFTVGEASLDLEPALRDALAMELPYRPLCGPDCPGLCPRCGERIADLPADHHHDDVVDARWAQLEGLLSQLDGEPDGEKGEDAGADAAGAAGRADGGRP